MELDTDVTLNGLMLIGALTPFVTAVAAKMHTPDWWKGILSITWAAIIGVVAGFLEASAGSSFDWGMAIQNGAGAWAVHLLTYFGISADSVHRLNKATGRFGLGVPGRLDTSADFR